MRDGLDDLDQGLASERDRDRDGVSVPDRGTGRTGGDALSPNDSAAHNGNSWSSGIASTVLVRVRFAACEEANGTFDGGLSAFGDAGPFAALGGHIDTCGTAAPGRRICATEPVEVLRGGLPTLGRRAH
jgi:hypothetical protein